MAVATRFRRGGLFHGRDRFSVGDNCGKLDIVGVISRSVWHEKFRNRVAEHHEACMWVSMLEVVACIM